MPMAGRSCPKATRSWWWSKITAAPTSSRRCTEFKSLFGAPAFVERNGCGAGNVQAFHPIADWNCRAVVAAFAHETADACAFRTQHEHEIVRDNGIGEVLTGVARERHPPE